MPAAPAVRPARIDDLQAIRRLLAGAQLTEDGVPGWLEGFLVARDDTGRVVGAVGLETHGPFGLLRSLAVHRETRGRGLARDLCRELTREAGLRGIETLYLLTTDAETYFERLGFEAVARSEAPEAIRGTREFSTLCPQSAVLMRLDLPRTPTPAVPAGR